MSGFLFTFLAVLLAGIGARDQLLIAGLAARNGQRLSLLLVAVLSSVATAALVAYAVRLVAPMLVADARAIFAGLALALSGGELILLAPKAPPEEPTHSLGATAIVLLAQQLTDAARFMIAGIAVLTVAPFAAGMGGAAAGVVVVGLGWMAGADLLALRLRPWRIAAGAILLVIGAALAYRGYYH